MQGLLGKKIGMTHVFEQGRQIPVTVLSCGPCVVLQRKRKALEGYDAVQLGFEDISAKRISQPAAGRFKKLNIAPKRYLAEFALAPAAESKEGDVVTVDLFKDVPYVDVVGFSKGKGFQGVMRRHRMRGGSMTHGGQSKRRPGAIGCCELPGRVAKGKRMPGHMGRVRVSQQNLKVVKIMASDNVILVGGAVPGHPGSLLLIKKSLKKGQASQ